MVWPPLSLPWGLLTCQDIPKADATRAIDCPVGDLNDVENSKAHADQSEGQGQEEEQKNCDVEACIELLYQMWEDCREEMVCQGQDMAPFTISEHAYPKISK